MRANRQVFADNLTTTGTQLRRVSGVNLCKTAPGSLRLVRGELHKLRPCHVRNAPVDALEVVLLHVGDVQLLEREELVFVHEPSAPLVSEVPAASVKLGLQGGPLRGCRKQAVLKGHSHILIIPEYLETVFL